MKILGIGEAIVDTTSIIRRRLDAGLPSEVIATQHDAGGPVLSALVLLAKLGADCSMMASLGQDKEGDLVRGVLNDSGVTLLENVQHATKKHTILVDAETGQRQKIRGGIAHTPLEGLDPEELRSFDMIIMDRHEPKAFYEVVRHLNQKTQLIVDPSTEVSGLTQDMLQHATCPIIPIETLLEIGRGMTLHAALSKVHDTCQKSFIVTLGELGSLVYSKDQVEVIAPLAVEVIDTNGAGDIYRGAFAYGRLQGWGLHRCAEYANAAAALQCTKRGNAMAVPDKEAIEAHVANAGRRHDGLPLVADHFAMLSGASTVLEIQPNDDRYQASLEVFAIA